MKTLEVLAINDTLKRCRTEYAEATKKLIDTTQFYNSEITDDSINFKCKEADIKVINSGTVSAAKDILNKTGKRTAILNFADAMSVSDLDTP